LRIRPYLFFLQRMKARAFCLSVRGFVSRPVRETLALDTLEGSCRVIIVAAAGNQGTIGSTVITGHPWVIPVVACDLRGKPVGESNLGHSIGRRGLRAPGDQIASLGAEGQTLMLSGTSAAAPFVTGAIALTWSEFPAATAAQLRLAFMHAHAGLRSTVTPPLLDAWAAYQALLTTHSRR
jgi:subtilisin family serine protease